VRNINVVVLTANLAADPELRTTPSGAVVCSLRVANSVRRRRGEQWVDKPSFFDVEVWGKQAEACGQWLRKGSRVVVHGEIEIDEWSDRQTGQRRIRPVIRQAAVTFGRAPGGRAAQPDSDDINGREPSGDGQRIQGGFDGPGEPFPSGAATADEIPF
jgi:single-strand DNA-binding protein